MNPFITFRENDKEGVLQYYILQRNFPHIVGLISEKYSVGNWHSTIAGYRMYVLFDSTLRGAMLPSYKSIGDEIQLTLDDMAEWFLKNRIIIDEKKYKKFKLNAASPLQ